MHKIDLFGYTICDNGTILAQNGKPISYRKTIQIKINGKTQSVSYARLVYYAFNQDEFDFQNHSYIVRHRDEKCEPLNALSNLYLTNKREYLDRDNNKRAKLSHKDITEIRRVYLECKDNKDKNYPFKKVSYRKLAEKYGVSHNLIKEIINGNRKTDAGV